LDWTRNVDNIAHLSSNVTVKYMSSLRRYLVACAVFLLTTAPAAAVQINLSGDSVDQYFRILEQYVLPLMVVSTIVLFCGYLASRIFHRTVSRRQDRAAGRGRQADDDTEIFLRGLKASPPIREPEPFDEPTADRTPEPGRTKEPRMRASHPLLRRRFAAARAGRPASETEPEREPKPEPTPVAAAASERAAPPPADDGSEGAHVSRLQAAFRRPDRADPCTSQPPRTVSLEPQPEPEEEEDGSLLLRPIPEDTAGKRSNAPERPLRSPSDAANAAPRPERRAAPDADARGYGVDDIPERREPTISVVQALKAAPAPKPVTLDSAEARARVIEIVDGFDHVASLLQQGSVMLGERIKNKQGLTLEDTQSLRINGFEQPKNVLEDLRKLGGDAADEVLNAFEAAGAFNKIVARLEQMAETGPLDEGWNDLIRSRVSETIHAVGQVRKTLGIYRRVTKNPANTENNPGTAGNTPEGGTGGNLPIGRRQV
jgi:hypothetical protein